MSREPRPIYTPEGHVDPELERQVAEAIRRYPNFDAEWWIGATAAISVVAKWAGLYHTDEEG
jgi:hypothetical protein